MIYTGMIFRNIKLMKILLLSCCLPTFHLTPSLQASLHTMQSYYHTSIIQKIHKILKIKEQRKTNYICFKIEQCCCTDCIRHIIIFYNSILSLVLTALSSALEVWGNQMCLAGCLCPFHCWWHWSWLHPQRACWACASFTIQPQPHQIHLSQ